MKAGAQGSYQWRGVVGLRITGDILSSEVISMMVGQ